MTSVWYTCDGVDVVGEAMVDPEEQRRLLTAWYVHRALTVSGGGNATLSHYSFWYIHTHIPCP